MQLKRYNKATAAVISGALATLLGAVVVLDQQTLGAVQTLLTAVLVYLVPNTEG